LSVVTTKSAASATVAVCAKMSQSFLIVMIRVEVR
jgi:hypothetical protein